MEKSVVLLGTCASRMDPATEGRYKYWGMGKFATLFSVRAHRQLLMALLGALCLGTLGACERCSGPSGMEPETPVPLAPAEEVGIAAIKARGTLRVLTRNNSTSYFVWRGRRMGFHYELAERLAERLGVTLEVLVPKDWKSMIPALRSGRGDVIAASMTETPARAEQVLFSRTLQITHIVPVWRKGTEPIVSAEDLSGHKVHVHRSHTYYGELVRLNERLRVLEIPEVKIVTVESDLTTEDLLEQVADEKIGYTLADEQIAQANKTYLPELEIGPAISADQHLAWAVHPAAEDLVAEINKMVTQLKREPTFNVIYNRYFKSPKHHAHRRSSKLYASSGQISPYDEIIKKAAERHDLDWVLLAAQVYQESRFDPQAESWAGARGLMQIMPATAKELGIENPENPAQSVNAGAAYLAQMRERVGEAATESDRLKMALAAYNCGLTHVRNAKKLQRELGGKADTWREVREGLRKLSQKKYYSRPEYGYVRASEPLRYVEQITSRAAAYRHALGRRDE